MPNIRLISALIVATAARFAAGQTPDAARAVSPDAFWQQVGDTTLTRLVDEAVRGGTSVEAARARVAASRAARRLSTFDLAPTVTAGGSALRTRQSMAGIPGISRALPQQDLYDVGFDAAWELDLFGRVRNNVSAQGAFAESAERGLDDARVTLSAEVGRAYFELRGAQRQLAVAVRNADVQRRTVTLTEERLTAGRGTAFDVERARAVLQLTLGATPALRAQIAAARYRIASLVGRPPAELAPALLADGPLPELPASVSLGATEEVVRARPDVLAAQRQLAAETSSLRSERAAYMPRFAITASTGFTANRIQTLTNTGASRLLVGPVVSFPLLDLGRVHERVNVARAREDEARADYRAAVLGATEETENAVAAYAEAHERLVLLGEAARSSTRAQELAQQRFAAGLTDLLQVLDAQRTLLDAENQLASAHMAAAISLVALYKAAGGTWTTR